MSVEYSNNPDSAFISIHGRFDCRTFMEVLEIRKVIAQDGSEEPSPYQSIIDTNHLDELEDGEEPERITITVEERDLVKQGFEKAVKMPKPGTEGWGTASLSLGRKGRRRAWDLLLRLDAAEHLSLYEG